MARKETRTDVNRRKFLAGAAVATTAATVTNGASAATPGAAANKRLPSAVMPNTIQIAAETGGIGAILRREGVYSSSLTEWRKQRDAGAFGALAPAKRGPKAVEANPLAAKLALTQRDNARLTLRLKRAEAIIELQKNKLGPAARLWR